MPSALMPSALVRLFVALVVCATAVSGCASSQAPASTQPTSQETSPETSPKIDEARETKRAGADSASYVVYTSGGEPASLQDVVAAADDARVIFVGETHDDPGAHALQLDLLRRLVGETEEDTTVASNDGTRSRPLALSMEMFERDVQPVVDEYLAGLITERHFVDDARVWSNYAKAYRPLVEFARTHDVPVLAANAPRRYVNRVFRKGPESLDSLAHDALAHDALAHARKWLAPLPYPGPSEAYQAKWNDLMRRSMPPGHGQEDPEDDPEEDLEDDPGAPADSSAASPHESPHGSPHGSPGGGAHGASGPSNMLQAQALWDATMAHTIAEHLNRHPQAQVLHLTGAFHVSRGSGTPDALRHYGHGTRQMIVLVQPTSDPHVFNPEEHEGLGDFVVLTPASNVPSQSMGMRGPRSGPGN